MALYVVVQAIAEPAEASLKAYTSGPLTTQGGKR